MLAKLVRASIDPNGVDDAARAVTEELVPAFVAHPGSRQGYWMADRSSGRVLVLTAWADESSLLSEQATDGRERARAAERVGLRIHAIQTLLVVAAHEAADRASTVTRWVRATCVEGVSPDLGDLLAELHAQAVSDQSLSAGFRASYWLTDPDTTDGLALSMWSAPAYLSDGEPDSRRRRRHFERRLGCRITNVATYEAIGVAARPDIDLSGQGMTRSPATVTA